MTADNDFPEFSAAQAANDLADAAARASTWLFTQRMSGRGNADDNKRWLNLEDALDAKSIALRATSIQLLGDAAGDAIQRLQKSSGEVADFMRHVADIQAGLKVVTALLGLAAAALLGDAPAVIGSLGAVDSALQAAGAMATP